MTGKHDRAAVQLADEIALKLHALEGLLGPAPEFDALRARLDGRAAMLTAQLESGDERIAAQTAIDLAAILPDAIPDDWWETPLGRLVAMSVGHPVQDQLSLAEAARVLRVSKTRVQQFVREQRLEQHPDGGVTAVSVAMLARKRAEEAEA